MICKHMRKNNKSEMSRGKYLELQYDNDSILKHPFGLRNSIKKLSKQMYKQ
jgi:hypothetical protein